MRRWPSSRRIATSCGAGYEAESVRVSDRIRELADREASLQLRSAMQRREIAREVNAVESRLKTVDRVVGIARGVAAVVGIALIGRATGFRFLGRGLLLATAARRALRVVRTLRAATQPRPTTRPRPER
jgi:hypothetical protein